MESNRRLFVHCRISEAERQALDRLQQIEAARPSEIMRTALRELARQRGAWPTVGAGEGAGQGNQETK